MSLEAQAGWRLSRRKGRKAPKGIVVGRLGFGSRMLEHKRFMIGIPLIILLQAAIIFAVWYFLPR